MLTAEVYDSDGSVAISLDGQDVATLTFVDKRTAKDSDAEAHWRELTDDERTAIVVLVMSGVTPGSPPISPAEVARARRIAKEMGE